MKKIFLILLLFFTIATFAQNIDISRDWKFQFGDNPAWAQLEIDDSQWKPMTQLCFVEDIGYPDFKGFAWFRKKIMVPSSLKTNAEKYGYINLVLGGIDDSDQGFFNGKMVGESGKLPPDEYVQGFYTFRIYKIDPKDVLWDKENIISVRLFDNLGQGGFYKGPYLFSVPDKTTLMPISKTITGFSLLTDQQMWNKKIRFPSNLKLAAKKMNGLLLKTNLPGNISLFLNDAFIETSQKSKQHSFFVPYNNIKWDLENDFTVCIAKSAANDEVLFTTQTLAEATLIDVLKVTKIEKGNAKPAFGKPFFYDISVINTSNNMFNGTLILELVSDIYKKEAAFSQEIKLDKNSTQMLNFKFQADFVGVYKVNYRLVESTGNLLMGQIDAGLIK